MQRQRFNQQFKDLKDLRQLNKKFHEPKRSTLVHGEVKGFYKPATMRKAWYDMPVEQIVRLEHMRDMYERLRRLNNAFIMGNVRDASIYTKDSGFAINAPVNCMGNFIFLYRYGIEPDNLGRYLLITHKVHISDVTSIDF